MRIQISTLEDYQDLILTLDIIAGDIVNVSNQLSNNHFKSRIYSKQKASLSYLKKLEQDNERLKKELKDLTAYLNQLVEQI